MSADAASLSNRRTPAEGCRCWTSAVCALLCRKPEYGQYHIWILHVLAVFGRLCVILAVLYTSFSAWASVDACVGCIYSWMCHCGRHDHCQELGLDRCIRDCNGFGKFVWILLNSKATLQTTVGANSRSPWSAAEPVSYSQGFAIPVYS